METLKIAQISFPVLALSNSGGHKTLDKDACNVQIDCVVLQKQPGKTTNPIGYWSHFLTDIKQRYDRTQRTCLTIVWSVLLPRPYLEGQCFTIRTDYDGHKWTLNLANSREQLAHRRLRLSEFDFDVIHGARLKHQFIDTLSQL